VKHLIGAPLLGWRLTLPTNSGQSWKGLARTNASLFRTFVNDGRKKVYNVGPNTHSKNRARIHRWTLEQVLH
jgi:hypothetical protein